MGKYQNKDFFYKMCLIRRMKNVLKITVMNIEKFIHSRIKYLDFVCQLITAAEIKYPLKIDFFLTVLL